MNLDINYRKRNENKKTQKPNYMELNNMLLKYQWVNNEIKAEIKNHLGTSDDENTTIHSPHHAANAVLKFTVI